MRLTRYLLIVSAGLAALTGSLLSSPALGQAGGLQLTTPYPSVAVEPGGTTTFDLTVTAPGRQRVALEVSGVPEGFTATLRGGGFVIDGVFTDPDSPPEVQLEVLVPPDIAPGTFQVEVTARAGGSSTTLTLDLRVAEEVPGGVTFTADFPQLRGASTDTFTFDLQLTNSTAREITFNLESAGPQGWQIDAQPSGQQQAATALVPPGGSETISVTADPPDDALADVYQIGVRAVGGGQTAEAVLQVEVIGNFALTLTTTDERLNAEATAGEPTELVLLVRNDGTAPLTAVSLTSSPPTEWEVTFAPETVDVVPAGQTANVTATITPSGEAVAGDYTLSITASTAETSQTVDVRTTVKTSSLFGIVGILLIVAAVAGLGWVFRRYGRR